MFFEEKWRTHQNMQVVHTKPNARSYSLKAFKRT